MRKALVCLLFCLLMPLKGYPLCPDDSLTVVMHSDTTTTAAPPESTTAVPASEAQEEDFQKGINSLFDHEEYAIDTTLWNNSKINAGHFDSETWPDTARIELVDTAQNHRYVHPFENCITSDFGQRNWFWHFGVDIRLAKGDSVRAAFDGIVRVTQFDRHGYGRVVVIRHSHGIETLYGHLKRELVRKNDKVHAGQVIGLGGSTGRSTGAHLHFETRFNGEPFDPNLAVDFENYELRSDTLVLTKADFAYLVDIRKAQWHVIRKGETLGHLARWYHTSVSAICRLNHISPKTTLRLGRKILVRTAPKNEPALSLAPKNQSKS